MHSIVQPHTHVVLGLPSGLTKVVEMIPNTAITLGKLGTFSTSSLLGRPYHLTFEIQDKSSTAACSELRVVSAAELQSETALTEAETLYGSSLTPPIEDSDSEAHLNSKFTDELATLRSNQLTIDDSSRQSLTMEEIELLKRAEVTDSGRAIIAKIKASHHALDEKTGFSLAKYALRKERKYLRRFVLFPLDPALLASYLLEREPARILELREETLALICTWSNAFYGGARSEFIGLQGVSSFGGGRWLVVDDTGGLVVAALAERMGILYPEEAEESSAHETSDTTGGQVEPVLPPCTGGSSPQVSLDQNISVEARNGTTLGAGMPRRKPPPFQGMSASRNVLTVIHPSMQPNLGLLKYFNFDASVPQTSGVHPLHQHLHTISWLQLLDPHGDVTYNTEIPIIEPTELATMKSSKRGAYHHKRRRWERVRRVVHNTRAGGFDGLVVASAGGSAMSTNSNVELVDVFQHCLPLLRGGAQVVAYAPYAEQLAGLADMYSKERRSVWARTNNISENENGVPPKSAAEGISLSSIDAQDFPLDPTLLLSPSLQTIRARDWQVLPGRTHPNMTGRGGAEGCIFTATKIVPAVGKVEARGNFSKRRKIESEDSDS